MSNNYSNTNLGQRFGNAQNTRVFRVQQTIQMKNFVVNKFDHKKPHDIAKNAKIHFYFEFIWLCA